MTTARRVAADASVPGCCEIDATVNWAVPDVKALLPDTWTQCFYQQGGGGPGADVFELFTPMLNWVEQDVAPGESIAARL